MKKSHPELSALEKSEILTTLNTVVLSELKPVSLGLAALYCIFSFSYYFLLKGPERVILAATAAISVLILLVLYLCIQKFKPNPANAHPIGTLIALIALFNGILHLYLTGDPQHTANLVLLILGVGFLFLSSFWYIIVISLTVVSWIIVAVSHAELGNWLHFGFFLVSAFILSGIIHTVRKRTRISYEIIRISEQRQSEKLKKLVLALEESREKYRDLFENASDLIQSVNAEGKFVYVNRAWEEILEYTEEDRQTLTFLDTIREDNRNKCAELFKKVSKGEIFKNIETVFVSKSGKEIYVEGNINPQIKDGEFISTRAIFRDITERKKAEDELKKLHEELKNVNERLKEAYSNVKFEKDVLQNVLQNEEIGFITNSHGIISAITEKARNLTGKNRLEILNSPLAELFEEADRETVTEAIRLANIKNFHSVTGVIKTENSSEIEYIINIMKLNTLQEKQLLVILRINAGS